MLLMLETTWMTGWGGGSVFLLGLSYVRVSFWPQEDAVSIPRGGPTEGGCSSRGTDQGSEAQFWFPLGTVAVPVPWLPTRAQGRTAFLCSPGNRQSSSLAPVNDKCSWKDVHLMRMNSGRGPMDRSVVISQSILLCWEGEGRENSLHCGAHPPGPAEAA